MWIIVCLIFIQDLSVTWYESTSQKVNRQDGWCKKLVHINSYGYPVHTSNYWMLKCWSLMLQRLTFPLFIKCVDHTVFHEIQIATHNNTTAPKILILCDLALCSMYTGTSKAVISENFSHTKLTFQAWTLIFMKHMSASYCRIALEQKIKVRAQW